MRLRSRSRSAFSLVEVTFAIAIISFSMMSIIGTMSVGLNTIREAKKDLVHALITSNVASTVLQTRFSEMDTLATGGPLYFDSTGRQLDTDKEAIYSATLVIAPGGTTTYPGAPADLDISAKTVEITVATLLGPSTAIRPTSRTVIVVPK